MCTHRQNVLMASSKTTPPSHHRLQILACHEIWLTRPTTSPVEEKYQSNGQLQRYYTLDSVLMELKHTLTYLVTRERVCFMLQALHYKKYSTASDVWSFGCLMYEIWSLGHKPFEGYTNSQVCSH